MLTEKERKEFARLRNKLRHAWGVVEKGFEDYDKQRIALNEFAERIGERLDSEDDAEWKIHFAREWQQFELPDLSYEDEDPLERLESLPTTEKEGKEMHSDQK